MRNRLSADPERVRDRLLRLEDSSNPAKVRRARITLMYDALAAIAEGSVEDPARIAAAVVGGIDRATLLRRDRAHNEQPSDDEEVAVSEAEMETPQELRRRGKEPDLNSTMQRHIQQMVKVLPEQRLIYVVTPKVASTTLKATLWRLGLGDPEATPPRQVHDTRFSPLKMPPDLGVDEFVQWANRDEYKRFCFVRNPYTRLLSFYLHRIAGNEGEDRWADANFRAMISKSGTNENVTFGEFIDYIAKQPPMKMNRHWRVQTVHLLWGRISYDFVGRIENFDADLDRLGALLKINLKPYLDVRNTRQTSAKADLSDYYSPQLQERVYKIYESDFTAFGYSTDLPSSLKRVSSAARSNG